jgi:hypothetical protein
MTAGSGSSRASAPPSNVSSYRAQPQANHPTSPAAIPVIDLVRKIPLVPAVLLGIGASIIGPQHATNEFYVVAAEIIPLLFLAIALEARLLTVQFPDIAALITQIQDSQKSLDEIETQVDGLPDDRPELVAEWRTKIADQREITAGQLEGLQQARPGMRRYRILVRLYAGITAVLLLLGELSALKVVAEGTYEHADAKWAVGAIVMGLVAVLFAAFRHTPRES